MRFEFAVSVLAVLTALIPAYSLPVGLWLSIVLLLASALLLWSWGLELLGWLMLIVYVGALAILFLFVVMLLDLGVPQVSSEASWLRFTWYALPWQLEGPMGHSSSQAAVSLGQRPPSGEWVSLAYLYHGYPEVVILLGCLLTLGLFGAAVVPKDRLGFPALGAQAPEQAGIRA
jgi:NADH-quinone oxidoreductase subunit J